MRRLLSVLVAGFALCVLSLPAQAAVYPEYNPKNPPKLRNGLKLIDFKYVTINKHQVKTDRVSGIITCEAFVPADQQIPADKSLPLAFGLDVIVHFDLRGKDKDCDLTYTLTVPKRSRRTLKPFPEKDTFLRITSQKIEGSTQTVNMKVNLNEAWWLPRSVSNKVAPGTYSYSVAINGKTVVQGSYELKKVSQMERQIFERKASVYFFARHAYPHFAAWVKQHNGKMPSTKEFLAALNKLRYFPAHDYTAHRGMPKTYAQLSDPGNTWLAREMRPAMDGNLVVAYADGTIGLATPEDFAGNSRRRRR